jgi:hypothetical protein
VRLQDPEQPFSFLSSALRELESPVHEDVLNLASTLGTHRDAREQSPDREQVRAEYLRREREVQGRLDRSREHLRLLERQRDETEHRDRLRRVMSRLSRLDDSSAAAYGDRTPSANNLYDWSPATEADDEELDHILDELRREQPNTHPEILRVLGRSQLESERERRSISARLSSERAGTGSGGESLRSTAILQSVRRHPRFSARTREYLSRYNTDRERDSSSRPSQVSESQARYMSGSAREIALQRLAASEDRASSLDRERREMLSRADSYRRNYLDHRTSTPPTVSPLLEQTVKYLSRIRHAETIGASLSYAREAGFLSKDRFCMQWTDFLTDTTTIPPPAETSWLAPGAVLSGCQHATSVAAATAPGTTNQFSIYDPSGTSSLSHLAPPNRPWLANSYSTSRSRSSQLPPEFTPAAPTPQTDRWPVKVTIHEVDWASMTLSATMEAYNVPSHPHPHSSLLHEPSQQYTRTSSITTYLEGEILDFNAHTLLTESFKSSPANDATYWRKLPPFADLSDEDVVKSLTSRKWLQGIGRDWVLMRWKERCFVKPLNNSASNPVPEPNSAYSTTHTHSSRESHHQPSNPYSLRTNHLPSEIPRFPTQMNEADNEHATFDDSGCGLTISGFYYTCLNRGDGSVKGLYFDPQSSPYQCLELESKVGGARGAWGFR